MQKYLVLTLLIIFLSLATTSLAQTNGKQRTSRPRTSRLGPRLAQLPTVRELGRIPLNDFIKRNYSRFLGKRAKDYYDLLGQHQELRYLSYAEKDNQALADAFINLRAQETNKDDLAKISKVLKHFLVSRSDVSDHTRDVVKTEWEIWLDIRRRERQRDNTAERKRHRESTGGREPTEAEIQAKRAYNERKRVYRMKKRQNNQQNNNDLEIQHFEDLLEEYHIPKTLPAEQLELETRKMMEKYGKWPSKATKELFAYMEHLGYKGKEVKAAGYARYQHTMDIRHKKGIERQRVRRKERASRTLSDAQTQGSSSSSSSRSSSSTDSEPYSQNMDFGATTSAGYPGESSSMITNTPWTASQQSHATVNHSDRNESSQQASYHTGDDAHHDTLHRLPDVELEADDWWEDCSDLDW